MAAAMPAKVGLAWLGTAGIGLASDLAMDRIGGTGSGILILYGIAITFIQVWITRETLRRAGVEAAMPTAASLSVYLQGVLIGLGVIVGGLLLILPGLYVFARWYLASVILIERGSGRRAAMSRSWEMLDVHWPAALGAGLIMFALSAAPLVVTLTAPALIDEFGVGWLLATNLFAAVGLVGGYLVAVALYLFIEQPASTLQEIFG
ncbi:MAG: hypothetical protein J0H88_09035 [Sphingomonadales bacterium]|nr:hypothetical protein [Sphingomonadales bacterium]